MLATALASASTLPGLCPVLSVVTGVWPLIPARCGKFHYFLHFISQLVTILAIQHCKFALVEVVICAFAVVAVESVFLIDKGSALMTLYSLSLVAIRLASLLACQSLIQSLGSGYVLKKALCSSNKLNQGEVKRWIMGKLLTSIAMQIRLLGSWDGLG